MAATACAVAYSHIRRSSCSLQTRREIGFSFPFGRLFRLQNIACENYRTRGPQILTCLRRDPNLSFTEVDPSCGSFSKLRSPRVLAGLRMSPVAYVDCPSCPAPPSLGCGDGAADAGARSAVVRADERRHLSRDQPAGRDGGLELSRGCRPSTSSAGWCLSASAASRPPSTASSISSPSRSTGSGILKVYFQPGTDHRRGDRANRLRSRNRSCRILPRGHRPPQIISYNAANVPVAQLNIFSDTLSEQQTLRLRAELHPHPAFHHSRLFVAGAARRRAARGHGQSRSDDAVRQRASPRPTSATRWRRPTSSSRRAPPRSATIEYNIDLNMSPAKVTDFNQLPLKYRRRHAGPPGRRRAGDRYASAADQRGARRRPARDLPDGDQARRRFDADGGRRGQGQDSADPGRPRPRD